MEKPEQQRWRKRYKTYGIRVERSGFTFTASVNMGYCYRSVLGEYGTPEEAAEAARFVIDGFGMPRVSTPRDIDRHRRDFPKELWTKPLLAGGEKA